METSENIIKERLRKLLESFNCTEFVYNNSENKISFYNVLPDKKNILDVDFDDWKLKTQKNGRIHPDDMELFLDICEKLQKGKNVDAKLRTDYLSQGIETVRVVGSSILDNDNQIIETIGFFAVSNHIDQSLPNHNIEEILLNYNLDPLTKILNKQAIKELVESELAAKPNYPIAFMMIDLDNFKQINDNYGHLFGDSFLVEVGTILKNTFADRGKAGRIGGDEFFVFLYDCSTYDRIAAAGKEVCTEISNIYRGKIKGFDVTCSIGISQYPIDGCTYEELFLKSDKCLYRAKTKGKNAYVIYNEEKHGAITKEGETLTALEETNRISNNKFISNVLEVLFSNPDKETAINIALTMIGNRYLLDRIVVYKRDLAYRLKLVYKWGTYDQIDSFISYADKKYHEYFNKDSIYSVYDVNKIIDVYYFQYTCLKKSNTKSFVQYIDNDIKGVRNLISFDMCAKKRLWQKEEIDTFMIISKIICLLVDKLEQ